MHTGIQLNPQYPTFVSLSSILLNPSPSTLNSLRIFSKCPKYIAPQSLIVGRLMTEQRLSDVRFPTLAVLMVPPATASTACVGLNDNRITTFRIGLAAVLAMMALIQLFILPDYPRRPFTISCWSFSFPLASAANTVGHWAIAAPNPGSWLLTWLTLIIATTIIGLLVLLTLRMVWRTSR